MKPKLPHESFRVANKYTSPLINTNSPNQQVSDYTAKTKVSASDL